MTQPQNKSENQKEHSITIKGHGITQGEIMQEVLDDSTPAVLLPPDNLNNQNITNDVDSNVDSNISGLIELYAKTWDILIKYDENRLIIPAFKEYNKLKLLKYETAKQAIAILKEKLKQKNDEIGELFGREKGQSLKEIMEKLYRTFDNKDLYPSIIEKAAHLIYFIIKDRPFLEGNKRIGCLLFLVFLEVGDYKLTAITPEALTTIAILIGGSDPEQKEIFIRLIVNLLEEKIE